LKKLVLLIELKSQRAYTGSMISLFTKSPTKPKGANSFTRDRYGVLDPKTELKKIHTTIYNSKYNTFNKTWAFKTEINNKKERLELKIKNFIIK